MATLGGILIIVAYNMSEWENFLSVLKGTRSDAAVLLATFLLTVFIDLTVAIEFGIVLAAFLFIQKMMKSSSVEHVINTDEGKTEDLITGNVVPAGVDIYEINGPLFFGAAYKFKEAMKVIENPAKVLIIRMRHVPIIDATGVQTIKEVHKEIRNKGTKLILSEVTNEQVLNELTKARLVFQVGKANITDTFEKAIKRSKDILES